MRTILARAVAVIAVVAGLGVGVSTLPASAATTHPPTNQRTHLQDWWW